MCSFFKFICYIFQRESDKHFQLEIIKWLCTLIIPETQGQSVGSGEKAGRKFLSTDKRAPGTNSHQTISKNSSGCWLLIGHKKMLCIIVPNQWTVSPEFFSWVRTQQLLSRHTYPVRSPSLCIQGKLLFSTFLTRNQGTTELFADCLNFWK